MSFSPRENDRGETLVFEERQLPMLLFRAVNNYIILKVD